MRGCEYRKGIRCELRFWRIMLRGDIVDNRLEGDVRGYDVNTDVDVDYCGWDIDRDMVSIAWHWNLCTIARW